MEKKYYSQRTTSERKSIRLNINQLVSYLEKTYEKYSKLKMFNRLGMELYSGSELFFIEKLGKPPLLPIDISKDYTKDDVFDLIEIFAEYIDTPIRLIGERPTIVELDSKGETIRRNKTDDEILDEHRKKYLEYHNNFTKEINRILALFEDGYELTEKGYIRNLQDKGLEKMADEVKSEFDTESNQIIDNARRKFFHYKSDDTDKKSAILELAGILENYKRSDKLKFNSKDESELFNLLNNFNLRHNNPNQKGNYDKEIYYTWIFHNLLSAINACFKIIER